MAYLGVEGYLANIELRDGKAHSQHNSKQFLKASIHQHGTSEQFHSELKADMDFSSMKIRLTFKTVGFSEKALDFKPVAIKLCSQLNKAITNN